MGVHPKSGVNFYNAQDYYDFVFKLMIVIGVSFIIPVFLVALNFAGIMSGQGHPEVVAHRGADRLPFRGPGDAGRRRGEHAAARRAS